MKKNVVIIILAILVLGLGCFIVYDKVINKDEKKGDNVEEKKDVENNIIDSETALYIGNELYSYAGKTVYGDIYNYNKQYEEGKGHLIYNYDEIRSHFASNNEIAYTRNAKYENIDAEITKINDNYYINHDIPGRGANASYQGTDLKIQTIEEYKIVFNAISQYYS